MDGSGVQVDVEEFTSELRSGGRSLSTVRAYQGITDDERRTPIKARCASSATTSPTRAISGLQHANGCSGHTRPRSADQPGTSIVLQPPAAGRQAHGQSLVNR